jgi:hypothetical protein
MYIITTEGKKKKRFRFSSNLKKSIVVEIDIPVIEIFSNDIVSGQLNTHGVAIEKDKDPRPIVCDSVPQHLIINNIQIELHNRFLESSRIF